MRTFFMAKDVCGDDRVLFSPFMTACCRESYRLGRLNHTHTHPLTHAHTHTHTHTHTNTHKHRGSKSGPDSRLTRRKRRSSRASTKTAGLGSAGPYSGTVLRVNTYVVSAVGEGYEGEKSVRVLCVCVLHHAEG